MPIALARVIVGAFAGYAALGLIFAPVFVARGIGRLDPSARGSSWAFRLLVVPGVVALWPYLLRRWLSGRAPSGRRAGAMIRRLRRRHRVAMAVLAVLLPLLLLAAVRARRLPSAMRELPPAARSAAGR